MSQGNSQNHTQETFSESVYLLDFPKLTTVRYTWHKTSSNRILMCPRRTFQCGKSSQKILQRLLCFRKHGSHSLHDMSKNPFGNVVLTRVTNISFHQCPGQCCASRLMCWIGVTGQHRLSTPYILSQAQLTKFARRVPKPELGRCWEMFETFLFPPILSFPPIFSSHQYTNIFLFPPLMPRPVLQFSLMCWIGFTGQCRLPNEMLDKMDQAIADPKHVASATANAIIYVLPLAKGSSDSDELGMKNLVAQFGLILASTC
jgi:hypothetical protein